MANLKIAAVVAAAALGLPSAATAATPQEFVGHIANYLNQSGFQVGAVPTAEHQHVDGELHYTVGDSAYTWQFPKDAAAVALPGRVIYETHAVWPHVIELAAKYGQRGKLRPEEIDDISTTIHEVLHQRGLRSGWYDARGATEVAGKTMWWWEEGVTEAVSRDILPHVTRDLFGHRLNRVHQMYTSFTDRVKSVRQLSVFATWPGKWTDKQATGWRSRLMMADYDGRAQMLRSAYARMGEAR